MCFRNYRLQKAWLLKCLKSPVSEHIWTVKMLKGSKHCRDQQVSSFVIFCDHCERTSLRDALLVVSEILRLFVNILTSNDKYSLLVKFSV